MTITVMTLIPMMGFAKVSDFNAMITENMNAQSELHNNVQDNVGETRTAVREKADRFQQRIVLKEDTGSSHNATTTRGILTFNKEKSQGHRGQKAKFERLATELNDSQY